MNIAVVGSRKFKNYEYMKEILDRVLAKYGPFTLVSGMADGADSLAIAWYARTGSLPQPIYHPAKWGDVDRPGAVIKMDKHGEPYDAAAGFYRNQFIVDDADVVIAFMDKDNPTSGTSDTIKKAKKKGIPVYIFWKE